jgi:hypothetical protein
MEQQGTSFKGAPAAKAASRARSLLHGSAHESLFADVGGLTAWRALHSALAAHPSLTMGADDYEDEDEEEEEDEDSDN